MKHDARSAGRSLPSPEFDSVDPRWQSLVEQYSGLLRASISRVCPHQHGLQVEDIEQEARLKLGRALKSERTNGSLATDLLRAAARASIDAVRRARARREHLGLRAESGGSSGWEEVDPQEPSRRQPERALVLAQVRECLGRQKAEPRRALALHLQGFTAQEIGRLLGWTEPRAVDVVHRGLQQLRTALRGAGIEHGLDEEEVRQLARDSSVGIGGCPPAEMLARAMSGSLTGDESQAVADHLAECADCAEDAQALRNLESWAERATLEGASPGRQTREVATGRWTNKPLLGVAAALFVTAAILSVRLFRVGDQVLPNVAIVDLLPAGASRGGESATATAPAGAPLIVGVLTVPGDTHRFEDYVVEVWHGGRLAHRGQGFIRSPKDTFTVALAPPLLAHGENRIRLLGLRAGAAVPIEEYALRIPRS